MVKIVLGQTTSLKSCTARYAPFCASTSLTSRLFRLTGLLFWSLSSDWICCSEACLHTGSALLKLVFTLDLLFWSLSSDWICSSEACNQTGSALLKLVFTLDLLFWSLSSDWICSSEACRQTGSALLKLVIRLDLLFWSLSSDWICSSEACHQTGSFPCRSFNIHRSDRCFKWKLWILMGSVFDASEMFYTLGRFLGKKM